MSVEQGQSGSVTVITVDPLQTYRALAEESVNKLRDQYDWRAKWHRRLFRFSGILVIVLSASLPLLAGFGYPGKNLVIAVTGVVIATATALRTFYQWDQMWALLRRTHFGLIEASSQWRLAFARAEATVDPVEREQRAYEATDTLLAKIEGLRSAETEKFFSSLAFPEDSPLAGKPFRS
ncbi:SLATT domain-containing protein [Micromonospora sp. NPDC047467]|uniref:SLATT domain-containing protein n=1 Tax=Micromonospora sp. NPDC047467 TaxID=3154814 RepID=UPI0033E486F8